MEEAGTLANPAPGLCLQPRVVHICIAVGYKETAYVRIGPSIPITLLILTL